MQIRNDTSSLVTTLPVGSVCRRTVEERPFVHSARIGAGDSSEEGAAIARPAVAAAPPGLDQGVHRANAPPSYDRGSAIALQRSWHRWTNAPARCLQWFIAGRSRK